MGDVVDDDDALGATGLDPQLAAKIRTAAAIAGRRRVA